MIASLPFAAYLRATTKVGGASTIYNGRTFLCGSEGGLGFMLVRRT